MPINYKEYHPKWSLISRLVRHRRAGGRCEWCGVPNYSEVYRYKDKWVSPPAAIWDMVHSAVRQGYSRQGALKAFGIVKIVLTVAHIDHNKDNNRFGNLAALCQRCHLSHDRKQHADNRRYGRNWKGKQQLKLDI